MKTILVPTDFNLKVFDCISPLVRKFKQEELCIIFTHMFRLSDSITDLLMLSRRTKEFEHVSDAFKEEMKLVKTLNNTVKYVKIDFVYGSTLSLFKNFLEGNDVDYVVDTEFSPVKKLSKASVEPSSFVEKSGLPIINITQEVAIQKLKNQDVTYLKIDKEITKNELVNEYQHSEL